MENKATKEEDTGHWVVLDEPISSCGNCIHNAACIAIKSHIVRCTEANYRFRCPIEVYVSKNMELVKHEEGGVDGPN